jgi:putative endonuclease
MPATYRVYILQNHEGRFYIGLSNDVAGRLVQHNSGFSKWTRGKGPWELIWQTKPMDLSAARKIELALKRQKGGDGFYRMTGLPWLGS